VSAGKKKRKGEEGRLTGGPRLSAPRSKRKREGGVVGWRGSGLGRLGRKEPVRFFFLFPFSNFIFKSFFNSNSIQTFLKNFVNF
jgi:hypothetical protein